MQQRLILLGAACLFSTGAVAADLAIEPAPIYVAPLHDWNGFYAGINGGYGGGVFEHPFQLNGPDEQVAPALVPPGPGQIIYATGSADVTAGGFVGGIQAGYNWQFDENFLIGLEADIQGSSIDGRVSVEITDEAEILGGGTLNADLGTSLDWFATVRPRIGWVNDRFVVYATGGLAWGQTTSSIYADLSGTMEDGELIDESITNDRFGWTIGAGIEYALTDNITFKTEYLYTDLGSEEILDLEFGEEVPYTFSADSSVAFHTVRAGLNFQF